MRTNFTLFTLIMVALFGSAGFSQSYQKHPRAMELERQMTKDALDFLKSRFPDYPVIVTVSIDPIYRNEGKSFSNNDKRKESTEEDLPFFKAESTEILDEWDDPSISNSALLTRVKKVVINVSVPGHITDDEAAEIKQSLTLNLNLLSARDSVEITKRSWNQKPKEPEFNPMNYVWIFLVALFSFFVVLLVAIWTPIRQIVNVLKDGVTSSKSKSDTPEAVTSIQLPPAVSAPASSTSQSGDMRVSDPIKIQTSVSVILGVVQKDPMFPTIDDMYYLDEICIADPRIMGAFLAECPPKLQELIFSLSYGQHWLEAIVDPGPIDNNVFEMAHRLSKIVRVQESREDADWQQLLISVWRLGSVKSISDYLKGINEQHAQTILFDLPKTISIDVAIDMFPGGWSVILAKSPSLKKPSHEDINKYKQDAREKFKIRDVSTIKQFTADRQTIRYLNTADPEKEASIMKVLPEDSLVLKMRPPFYKFLEAETEVINEVLSKVSLTEVAIALTNTNSSSRSKIESVLSVKQKSRLLELISSFSLKSPDVTVVAAARKKIALIVAASAKSKTTD